MRQALKPILFDDHDKQAADAARASIVAKAARSEAAKRKVNAKRTDDDLPVHSFQSLIADLATFTRNTMAMGDSSAIFLLYPHPRSGARLPAPERTGQPVASTATDRSADQRVGSIIYAFAMLQLPTRGSEYAHEYSQRRHRNHPAFPRDGFTGYNALSSVTGLSYHRRSVDDCTSSPGWAPRDLQRNLTPASGVRTTRLCRPQHCRSSRMCRPLTNCFTLRSQQCTTASRPPHPPNVRDDREAPLWSEAGRLQQITYLRKAEVKFFRAGADRPNHVDAAGEIRILRGGDLACPSGARASDIGGTR